MKTINQLLMEQCCNFRCGIALPFQRIPNNFCDISNVYNYSVPEDSIEPWKTASGSLNFDENKAIMGAIGESLERYSGAICNFDMKSYAELNNKKRILYYKDFSLFAEEQYNDQSFSWKKPNPEQQFYGKVYSLYDNKEWYVPQELIGLGSKKQNASIPSTSTGIAAHTNKLEAISSALLEVLERDALTTYWLHSIGGREISLDDKYTKEVKDKKGQIFCFDITQDWNPYPVVIVCGYLLVNNKKRISMGVACRENYEKAIEKAYLEWIQGCVFAGYYDEFHADIKLDNSKNVNSFDLHAVYYTKHPEQWENVPLIKYRSSYKYIERNNNLRDKSIEYRLKFLLKKLRKENIRLFYKDITTSDVREVGVTVIRVLSPDLALLHGDENEMFLGGKTKDIKWRYKDLKSLEFPNRYPHPLG
ncbi:MAG: YcaO-like family protein [Bacilli bacterium]|nr:YcaO-like family protein [Bacilli bacterium]